MRPRPWWLLLWCVAGCGGASGRAAPERPAALPAVGATLTSFEAASWRSGQPVPVSFPAPGPVALIVFDRADCVSCLNLVHESWSLARWAARHGAG